MTIADNFQILPTIVAVDNPITTPIMPRIGSAFVNLRILLSVLIHN
jgi:hypothetical protein